MDRIHYNIADDGVSITAKRGKAAPLTLRVLPSHCNFSKVVPAVQNFNRGVKRGDSILVTGDRPRFALMRTYPEDRLDPDLIKLGDGRIHMKCLGLDDWLDACDVLEVMFKPGCTHYRLHFDTLPQLDIELLVCQAEDWGLAGQLSLINHGEDSLEIEVDLVYGGLRRCERTHDAAYFEADDMDGIGNQITLDGEMVSFFDDNMPDEVFVRTLPHQGALVKEGRVHFPHPLVLPAGGTARVGLICGHSQPVEESRQKFLSANFDRLFMESEAYYQRIFAQAVISTPSQILDAGFRTAVWNLDCVYADQAWLEGVHWWSAFWTNNYQISAALALGQTERARKALDFYCDAETGPCPAMTAAGEPSLGQMNIEDGLPYYIYSLCQYYHQTGDASLLRKVWPQLTASIDRMFIVRGGVGDGLLDWHLGCNAFLYQADHLGMPGEAASPSLMMAGMLEKLSQIATSLGKGEDASRWETLAGRLYAGLRECLWNAESGVFYSHIDLQGIRHMAHYYTDLVFPTLYTSLDDELGHPSLEYLIRTLWVERVLPEPLGSLALMRVGNYQPSLFGNDNIMPTQMAEAARAFFKTGQSRRGLRLLEATAWAGTVHTEAPGNFPEHMSEDGKGEANYLFGNPIGSFIYAVVEGLFGLGGTGGGETIVWQPAFPWEWTRASLDLAYACLSFQVEKGDETQVRRYALEMKDGKRLHFRLILQDCTVEKVVWNGHPQDFERKPMPGGSFCIIFSTPANVQHVVEIFYRNNKGEEAPGPIGASTAERSPLYMPAEPEAAAYQLKMDGENVQPIDLSRLFNSSKIHVTSAWRDVDLPMRLDRVDGSVLEFFSLPETVENMLMVEFGRSHQYTRQTEPSLYPSRVRIPVKKRAKAVSLLYASEVESRHTGARLGTLQLVYASGMTTEIPLVAGENLDTIFRHWATLTFPIPIVGQGFREEDYLNLYRLECDPETILQEFVIEVNAADVQLGLLAASISLG